MDKNPPLLKLSDLNIHLTSHQTPTHIVRGLDLNIFRGDIIALVGESGCGKSITAQAIMGLLNPNRSIVAGEIWYNQIPLHLMNDKQMQQIRGKEIGMVFQDPSTSLNPLMKVGLQITESMRYHQGMSRSEARQNTIELLSKVGISDPAVRFDAYPFQLSGGMRQRIGIAIALACSPKLLIADEPTTALDVTVQAQILDLLKNICKTTEMSLLLITHDLGVVAGMADWVAVMKSGEIVEQEKVDDVFYFSKHPYTQTLMAAKHK